MSCIVEYETAEAADYALADGYYFGGVMFEMECTPKTAPPQPDYIDADVQMELNAMSGSSERRVRSGKTTECN